jgi:hypothetical protein
MKTIHIIVLVLILGLLPTIAQSAGSCFERPDFKYEPRGSYLWRWQLLDNDARKCWYYANRVLPKTQLFWPKGKTQPSRVAPQPDPSPAPSAERGPESRPWVLEHRWY